MGTHPFEKAGLGLAPFKLVGVYTKVGPIRMPDGSSCGAPGQPMGCCKYCYQGIATCCLIQSADGKRFEVGSTCVYKVAQDSGTDADSCLERSVRRETARLAREARQSKDSLKIKWARANLERVREKWSALPHPRALRSLTLWNWATWMLDHAGTRGRLEVVRRLEQELGEKAKG